MEQPKGQRNADLIPKANSWDTQSALAHMQREMEGCLKYSFDCNKRKWEWARLAVVVFSVVAPAVSALLACKDTGPARNFPHLVDALIGSVLVAVAFIYLAILKELISIHAGRVVCIRQMNALRQAMDSIIFRDIEGSYPQDCQELRDTGTLYWQFFGKYRKLELDDSGLRESERSFVRSPDRIMIYMVAFLSLLVIAFPVAYSVYSLTVYNATSSFKLGVTSGVLSTLFVIHVIHEIRQERKRLERLLV